MPGSRPHHSDKWRRCVQHVEEKNPSANAYAVCTSVLGPSIEGAEDDLAMNEADFAELKDRLDRAMDDMEGRGDVAEPAGDMPRALDTLHSQMPENETPRAMDSRCRKCGTGLSVRDADRGGFCEMCESVAMGDWDEAKHPRDDHGKFTGDGDSDHPGQRLEALKKSAGFGHGPDVHDDYHAAHDEALARARHYDRPMAIEKLNYYGKVKYAVKHVPKDPHQRSGWELRAQIVHPDDPQSYRSGGTSQPKTRLEIAKDMARHHVPQGLGVGENWKR